MYPTLSHVPDRVGQLCKAIGTVPSNVQSCNMLDLISVTSWSQVLGELKAYVDFGTVAHKTRVRK